MAADFDLHRKAMPGHFKPDATINYDAAKFSALIKGPDSTIWVAERSGKIEGMAVLLLHAHPENLLHPARRIGEIDYISVRETSRRQGIGKALVEACALWARAHTCERVALNVYAFNEAAIGFYKASGFAPLYQRMSRKP
jgi:GNAT superfamily N-acetyltransferase